MVLTQGGPVTLFDNIAQYCQAPNPNALDIAGWNDLKWEAATNTKLVVSVGLFQWDMSCIQSICASADQYVSNNFAACGLINSGEVDGIAIATHWDVELAAKFTNTNHKYGVVFSGADKGEGDLELLSVVDVTAGNPKNMYCFKFGASAPFV